MDFFSNLITSDYWIWFIIATVLFIIEILSGTVFLLWTAISAVIVGGLAYFFPDLLQTTQAIIFALLAFLSIAVTKLVLKNKHHFQPKFQLNERGTDYIGKTYVLENPITRGTGQIKIDDTYWTLHGPDLPAGSEIKIVAMDGVGFTVKAAK